jgi:uncharacterized protein (DUF58 family)
VDGALLAALDRLSLAVDAELTGGLMGEHAARRRTAGIEFTDHRPYSPGDDVGRVDWNAYARLGSLHVRQSQAEHDTTLYILVDASPSMQYGTPCKFFTARRLAAALGYVALAHLDSVVLAAPGGRFAHSRASQPFRGRTQAAELFSCLHELHTGEAAPLDAVLTGWAASLLPGAGTGRVAVIISDLLLDAYRQGVDALVAAGVSVIMLHVLSPQELRPPERGDLELVDSETGRRLPVHLNENLLAAYEQRLLKWLAGVEQWCRDRGTSYVLASSDADTTRVVLNVLRRIGVAMR